jgi:hypothetical protein
VHQCDSAAFAHDPYGVFAGIESLAFVRNELFLDVDVCIPRSAYSLGICRKLGVAILTDAKHRNIILSSDDPKLAFRSPDAGGCCSANIAQRPLTVMELLGFVQDGLNRHEWHRLGLRRQECSVVSW